MSIRFIDETGAEHRVKDGAIVKVQTAWYEVIEWKIVSCGDDEYHFEIANPGKEHGSCYHVRQAEERLRNNKAKVIAIDGEVQ